MKKVLFIVGSLRQGSFNGQLAQQAEKLLQGKAEVSYLTYDDVPVFSQDLETPVLDSVARVRQEVLSADAIWLFSPVYNSFIPAPVKNLFDWLSRAMDLSDTTGQSALHEKLIAVSVVAAGDYPAKVIPQYEAYLPFIRMDVLDKKVGVSISPSTWGTGKLELLPSDLENLQEQAGALLTALNN